MGKTAVVEGFAAAHRQRATCRRQLKDVIACCTLDVGLLQAGASMKGRVRAAAPSGHRGSPVQSPKPIILCSLMKRTRSMGAGGQLPAPATRRICSSLPSRAARLRTDRPRRLGDEYKKHIEKDPALTRRFQVVQVGEPSEDKAIADDARHRRHRLGKAPSKIRVLDEAIEAAVKLSHRYIPARQLPDKSVSLLDTASARVAVSQHAVPAELEDCQPPHRSAAKRS